MTMKNSKSMKKGMPFMKKGEAKDKPMKFAKGGGIESKGKTRGKMVKMAYGGKC
jgi:hypothetical protein